MTQKSRWVPIVAPCVGRFVQHLQTRMQTILWRSRWSDGRDMPYDGLVQASSGATSQPPAFAIASSLVAGPRCQLSNVASAIFHAYCRRLSCRDLWGAPNPLRFLMSW